MAGRRKNNMDKKTLEKMALANALNLTNARRDLFAAAEKVMELEAELDAKKSATLLSGEIDGKNEETRKAQLKSVLSTHYEALFTAQKAERTERFRFEQALSDAKHVDTLLTIAAMED